MDDVIKRLQSMVKATGFDVATLACSAAAQGDLTVLDSLYRSFGAEAFRSNTQNRRSAYEYAAATNQVGVLRWLVDKQILPPLSEYTGDSLQHPKDAELVRCDMAFVAMEQGALESLEFIADQMPRLRQLPVHAILSGVDFPVEEEGSNVRPIRIMVVHGDEVHSLRLSYAGLMAGCIAAAKIRGRDTAPMMVMLDRHLTHAPSPLPADLRAALHLGSFDVAKAFLDAGARIDLFNFLNSLKEAKDPVAVLTFLADYLQSTGKGYDDIVAPLVERGSGPTQTIESYASFLASTDAFGPFLYQVVNQISEAQSKAQYRPDFRSDKFVKLPAELLRFASLLAPDTVGTAMMRAAVKKGALSLVEEMLKMGVDPNAYGRDVRSRSNADEQGLLPVHVCEWQEMLRLLHRYGADVNLPKEGDENVSLLQKICTVSLQKYDADFLHVFAECGGDFARKFDGKTAASLAKKKGEEFYQAFLAAKTSTAVAKTMDFHAVGMDAKQSRAPKSSPL